MITNINLTASPTLEERIVAIANNNIDSTATKIVCVTNGNLLRYKLILPTITTRIYTGVFSTATTAETIILNLPSGIIFEDIITFDFKAYYNTALSTWNIGVCWALDFDNTIYFASNSGADNPTTSTTFKMYRKSSRMTNAPYRLTIQYYAV